MATNIQIRTKLLYCYSAKTEEITTEINGMKKKARVKIEVGN